ncbi:DUF6702 family protein [Fluviicola chungangensis]|uniref:Peptidase E n=1 Tax=Fluviicola chungangensis TaxID=2597671 RepID=A0A556N6D9_9FLAO|nr:DUF6702 family protein [Fluviicola chungangensis]TSJ47750.1 hypothetical protein FO442_01075 [Fluviicola chungangensis]
MKKLIAVFAFFFVLFSVNAHEYYFAFGEVEYNASTKKLEITLEMSAHDVEFDMKRSGTNLDKHIEDQVKNQAFKKNLETYLAQGFKISNGDLALSLTLIGFDVSPNGMLYAYLESAPVKLDTKLTFCFNLLMESFPDQQNKITFIRNNEKQTAVFLPAKPTEVITL